MATLSITYTPQITSSVLNSSPFICHRICYRQGSAGPYCCLEDDTDSVAGTPKVFVITIAAAPCASVPDVDPESCLNTVYEGYVQACCEDEVSLAGRTDWSASYIADPSCVNKLVCCQSQRALQDSYLVITDDGNGYNDALSPLSVVVVRDPSDPVAPGGANDATIEATLSGGVVTALTVTAPGLYGMTPLLVIPSPTLGSPVTATAIAVIPCADTTYLGNCNTSPQEVILSNLLLGECTNMCFPNAFPFIYDLIDLSGPPNTADYLYTTQGCCDCSTCRNYTVITGSDLATLDICYTRCSNDVDEEEQICTVDFAPGSGSFNIDCAVPGSIFCYNDAGAILSITDNGACGDCP